MKRVHKVLVPDGTLDGSTVLVGSYQAGQLPCRAEITTLLCALYLSLSPSLHLPVEGGKEEEERRLLSSRQWRHRAGQCGVALSGGRGGGSEWKTSDFSFLQFVLLRPSRPIAHSDRAAAAAGQCVMYRLI